MSELKMPHINQVALSGRLVQDAELRTNDNGIPRLSGRIAVNRPFRDRDGAWREETSFFNFVCWQKMAEHYAERLAKGTPLFVSGRLRSHTWKDEEDKNHSLIEIQARTVQILARLPESEVQSSQIPSNEMTLPDEKLAAAA